MTSAMLSNFGNQIMYIKKPKNEKNNWTCKENRSCYCLVKNKRVRKMNEEENECGRSAMKKYKKDIMSQFTYQAGDSIGRKSFALFSDSITVSIKDKD